MMPLSVPENIEYSFISEVIEAFIRDVAVYDINHPERTISDKYSLCSDLMRLVLEKITEAMHLSGVNSTESDGKIESYFFNLLQNTEGESAKYLESQVAIIVEWLPKILSGLNRETNFATYQSILEILIKPYNNIIRTAHDLDDNRSTTAIAYSEHDEMMWNFVRYTLNTEAKDFAIVREFEELYWAFEIIKLWDNLEF
ncbi:MAG: hypothetical protein FJ161_03540, partial [Gammaproteobacteria bacterium]|nr:hypothetical protein [Gammaproteobacteria bacterium]